VSSRARAALARGISPGRPVVTVSRFFEDGLRDRGLSQACTIQNQVDLGSFRPEAKDPTVLEQLGIHDGQIVVVHVSKIEPIKRPVDLVAVASKIGPAADLVYVIIGEGPLLAEMRGACRRLMVVDRFRFVGWVPYDRIPFERGNLDSFAKTISLVANDGALRERIGRSALTSVASHALERMAVEYDRVFREIVASP
jgi:glycosyltransferase involved in cell wall biosynthesis